MGIPLSPERRAIFRNAATKITGLRHNVIRELCPDADQDISTLALRVDELLKQLAEQLMIRVDEPHLGIPSGPDW